MHRWIVNQTGQVYEVDNSPDADSAELIMDISKKVNPNYGEMGLLGLAFSPDFETSKKFYVNYIDRTSGQHNTVIARYSYVPGKSADTSSTEARLLKFQQPYEVSITCSHHWQHAHCAGIQLPAKHASSSLHRSGCCC